jgi:hypothetical protein
MHKKCFSGNTRRKVGTQIKMSQAKSLAAVSEETRRPVAYLDRGKSSIALD